MHDSSNTRTFVVSTHVVSVFVYVKISIEFTQCFSKSLSGGTPTVTVLYYFINIYEDVRSMTDYLLGPPRKKETSYA